MSERESCLKGGIHGWEKDQTGVFPGPSGQLASPEKQKTVKKASVQIHEPPVTETRGYSVARIEEKHGPFHRAIPVMPLPLAIICCLLNVALPGIGTLISAFSVFCCGTTRIAKPVHAFWINVASSLLQMITFLVIVGWIWSIRWGMTMVQLALSSRNTKRLSPLPYYVRRQSSIE